MSISVIFSRSHNLGSLALRTAMWSPWSHCGIIDGDDVIQAVAHPFGLSEVIRTPLAEFKAKAAKWAIVDFEGDAVQAIKAAKEQLGKPYDWGGVIGIGLHRNWQEQDAWFCSELVAYCLEEAGCKLFRLEAKRITPQYLWMVNRPILLAA